LDGGGWTYHGDPWSSPTAGATKNFTPALTMNGTTVLFRLLQGFNGSAVYTSGSEPLNGTGRTITMYVAGAPQATITNYCAYHIQWQNSCPNGQAKTAMFGAKWMNGPYEGTEVNLHPETTSWAFTLVPRGGTVDFWYTNYVGTNGTCWELAWGDLREDACAEYNYNTPTVINATNRPAGTNSGSGQSLLSFGTGAGGTGGDGIDPRTGNTNGASADDIAGLGDRLIAGMSAIEWEIWYARTNLGGIIYGSGTNIAGQITNWMSELNRSITNKTIPNYDGAATNAAQAVDLAAEATDQLDSYGDGSFVAGVMNSLEMGPTPGGSTAGSIMLGIGANTIEMVVDPFTGKWGMVWDMFHNLARWILLLGYVTKVAIDSHMLVQGLGQAQQLRLPNFEATIFGVGGNWGAVLYIVIVPALLTLFGVAIAFFVTQLTGTTDWITELGTNPLTSTDSAVTKGINALVRAFPLQLAVDLAGSYILFRLAATKALSIMVVAVRMLVG